MKMTLDFIKATECPSEWKDGRRLLGFCYFLSEWHTVRWEKNEGWIWYSSGELMFSEYPYDFETMDPDWLALLPADFDHGEVTP